MRAVGEGSLYKTHKNGRMYWVAQVVVGEYPNGNPRYARAVRKYRADALEQLDVLRRQKASGVVPDRTMNVAVFLEDWLTNQMPKSVKREKNQKQIGSQLRRLIIPTIGKTKLARLTIRDVENALDKLIADGYAPKSVNDIRSHLVSAFSYAVKHEKMAKNVAQLASTYKVGRPKNEGLTVKEVAKVLKIASDHHYSALWVMALHLGLRKSELINLTWKDIDLEACSLTISDAKTEAGDRELPLLGPVLDALLAHADGAPEGGYVFLSPTGLRVGDARVNEMWSKILEAADIEHRTFHGSTRDTITNLMHEAGVDREAREYILGHGVKGVAKHYLKPTQDSLRAAFITYQNHLVVPS